MARYLTPYTAKPIIYSRELRWKLYADTILQGMCLVAFFALCVAGAALVITNY